MESWPWSQPAWPWSWRPWRPHDGEVDRYLWPLKSQFCNISRWHGRIFPKGSPFRLHIDVLIPVLLFGRAAICYVLQDPTKVMIVRAATLVNKTLPTWSSKSHSKNLSTSTVQIRASEPAKVGFWDTIFALPIFVPPRIGQLPRVRTRVWILCRAQNAIICDHRWTHGQQSFTNQCSNPYSSKCDPALVMNTNISLTQFELEAVSWSFKYACPFDSFTGTFQLGRKGLEGRMAYCTSAEHVFCYGLISLASGKFGSEMLRGMQALGSGWSGRRSSNHAIEVPSWHKGRGLGCIHTGHQILSTVLVHVKNIEHMSDWVQRLTTTDSLIQKTNHHQSREAGRR